jgi:hypothetical protein
MFWHDLTTRGSRKTIAQAFVATVGGGLVIWVVTSALTSHAETPAPTINVSPVQSVQQTVTIAGQPQPESASVNAGQPLILIVAADSAIERELTARAARAIAASGDAFQNDFAMHGFTRAFEGDASGLAAMSAAAAAPAIVLGRARVSYASGGATSTGLRQADVSADLRLYRPRAGFATQTAHLTASGAGASDDEARAQAYERLVLQIQAAVSP